MSHRAKSRTAGIHFRNTNILIKKYHRNVTRYCYARDDSSLLRKFENSRFVYVQFVLRAIYTTLVSIPKTETIRRPFEVLGVKTYLHNIK